MKSLLLLLFLILNQLVLAQDSITITLKGKSIEFQKQEPIINTRLETSFFFKNNSFKKDIITDEKGEFVFNLRVAKETSSVSLEFNAEKSGFSNHFIYTFSCSGRDTTITFSMQLNRERVCKDTWLPSPILFSRANCDSTEDSFNELIAIIEMYKSAPVFLNRAKLVVTAYNSYIEKSKSAKCRAEKIKSLLLENGLKENQFIIIVGGKKDFTHYYYSNGCHTEKEFEEKIDLSKSAYKKASSEQKKEMDILRQSVRFEWK